MYTLPELSCIHSLSEYVLINQTVPDANPTGRVTHIVHISECKNKSAMTSAYQKRLEAIEYYIEFSGLLSFGYLTYTLNSSV
jgi:hypothetical protein